MKLLQFLVVLDDLVIIQSVNELKMSEISTSWFKYSDQHFSEIVSIYSVCYP